MMDCASITRAYSRYILIILNLIFSFTGIIIISVGVSVKAYFHEFETLLDQKYFYISDFLIIIGVIIFFISFFGCFGALKENACMTTTYSALLIIIFLLEIAVGLSGVLLKNKTEDFLVSTLNMTMDKYGMKNNSEYTLAWDNVQREFQCCGIQNASDWANHNATNHVLPMSCCEVPSGTMGNFTCSLEKHNFYPQGCLSEFGNFIDKNISAVEGVSITLAVIQLLGIIFSCYLSKSIRSDYETV